MSATALVEAVDVVKKYHDVVALDGVSLAVAPGETVALIGPSGCGKSTLCRSMIGLEPIHSGRVDFRGVPFVLPSGRRNDQVAFGRGGRRMQLAMGMVFQEFSLFPQMDVLTNVTLGPRKVLGRREDAARATAARVLASVGLEGFDRSFPEKLSGGQKQRVAIARELAMERQVIYLDEVTSALDPELVHEVLQVIRGLTDTGITIVMVTHEMAFARSVADRVVFMDRGSIVEEGTPASVFEEPQHARTRAFLEKVL